MTDNNIERESSEIKDKDRAESIYLYLLRCLTDMGMGETGEEKRPNEYKISKQWGQNRIFVRRVLRSVIPENYLPHEEEKTIPKLTLGKLVEILLSIEEYRKKSPKNDDNMTQALTREEKLMALRKFSQLSLKEQESPAIPNSECSPRHKNLKVPTGKGFAMKIPNEETRKNSGQREKRGHQA
jgi:hypothetical protein